MLSVTDDTFEAEIGGHRGLALVDFTGEGCPACRRLSPVLDELATEMPDQAKFAKVDVYENNDLAVRFGIQSIPQLVLFKDGAEVDRLVGYQVKSRLANWLKSKG
ncbi:MAG: thioredoxin domain-containing protein [Planctomycetota bacterium]